MDVERLPLAAGGAAALRRLDQQFLWHAWSPNPGEDGYPIIVAGQGSNVVDLEGRTYLDAKGCVCNAAVGYSHPQVVAAITIQARTLMHYDLVRAGNIPAIRLAAAYARLLPEGLSRTLFCSSGSEANEAAIKLARLYHRLAGQPSRQTIVSLRDGYHGTTLGTVALTGLPAVRAEVTPSLPGFAQVDSPVCRGCVEGVLHDRCCIPGPKMLEAALLRLGPQTVAAVIMEPILGVAGVLIPPDGYLAAVREICDRHGVFLILDEVLTGFGRTGKLFGFQHDDAPPDILTTSKQVSGGYAPLGAMTARQDLYEAFATDPQLGGFRHGHTSSGHAIACAAALAVLDVLDREGLVGRAAQLGGRLLADLAELRRFPIVRDVRGRGLLVGIQLDSAICAAQVAAAARERGVIVGHQGTVVSLTPPLVLTDAEAHRIVAVLLASCAATANGDGQWER
ncbi:MAG: aspartate aminotransferase family protein [Egibacteraceae bacterium]